MDNLGRDPPPSSQSAPHRRVLGIDQFGVHVSDDGVLARGHGAMIAGCWGWGHDLKVVYSLWKMKVIMRIVA